MADAVGDDEEVRGELHGEYLTNRRYTGVAYSVKPKAFKNQRNV